MATNPNELVNASAVAEQLLMTQMSNPKVTAVAEQVLLGPGVQALGYAFAEQLLLQPPAVSPVKVTWWVT